MTESNLPSSLTTQPNYVHYILLGQDSCAIYKESGIHPLIGKEDVQIWAYDERKDSFKHLVEELNSYGETTLIKDQDFELIKDTAEVLGARDPKKTDLTYILCGSEACRVYFDEGLDAVADLEPFDIHLHVHDANKNSIAELLNGIDGWNETTILSEDEYNILTQKSSVPEMD